MSVVKSLRERNVRRRRNICYPSYLSPEKIIINTTINQSSSQ
jgi:N-acetylmuramoyl-L-alanine amidase CwlA